MNFAKTFLTSIETVIDDETSFVICNTKAEKYLLEKIAYHLQINSSKQQALDYDRIALEYSDSSIKRMDMVVLKNSSPSIAIEAKYYYSFDRLFNYSRERSMVKKDIEKLKRTSLEAYFVLFIVHYDNTEVPRYFKYGSKHNRQFSSLNTAKMYYLENLTARMNTKPNYCVVKVGQFMGVPVDLLTFIIQVQPTS